MKKFYVSKDAEMDCGHEVHREGCMYLPPPERILYLGKLACAFSAVSEARKLYRKTDGCLHCTPECHLG